MGYISWSIVETKNFDHYMAENLIKFVKMQKNIKSRVGSLLFKIEQNRFQILDRREILHQIGHLPEKFWFGSTPTSGTIMVDYEKVWLI